MLRPARDERLPDGVGDIKSTWSWVDLLNAHVFLDALDEAHPPKTRDDD
uniref:Uncharacterized protein n=1 Tax=viral metagenome TaxID=1070528 RepID=A0A6M3M5P9_9ZZZZ